HGSATDPGSRRPAPGGSVPVASPPRRPVPYGSMTPLASSFSPQQIRTAYGVDQILFGAIHGDGTGQTIAIVDPFENPSFVSSSDPGFSSSDLAQFDAFFKLPDPPSFTKLNQDGLPGPLPPPDPTGGWATEIALDVEWAHALAPAASIILV